jgi:Fic family protein
LTAIRNQGDWEGWLKFFLRGVYEVSQASTTTARAMFQLRENHRDLIIEKMASSTNGFKLLDHLFEVPIITIRAAEKFMEVSFVTASSIIKQMEELGILKEITGQQRNKVFRYEPYLELFSRQAISLPKEQEETGSDITISH